ncbi:MAG: hypothetical protein H7Z19_01515, partial [Chitinophagaceae bacterium]|nr:hypothetical protein [Rubrivivax sp.]
MAPAPPAAHALGTDDLLHALGNPLILIESLRAGGTGAADDGNVTGRVPPAAGVRQLFVD